MRLTRAEQKVAAVRLRLQFSETEQRDVHHAADDVWNEIAHDMCTGDDGRPRNVRRDVVIEVVCDADRLTEAIRDPALRAKVRALPWADLYALVRPAFPHQWYGL